MVDYTSGAELISTQQDTLKAPPSRKPSAYMFDSNGDTFIILSTYEVQSFKWEADQIWIEQDNPTWSSFKTKNREKAKDCYEKTVSDLLNAHYLLLAHLTGEQADRGFNDPDPSSDSTDHRVQDRDHGETCELPIEKIELRMLVSGKHLELASPIFKTMLTGPFTEGSADSSGYRQITASDWDPETFKIVLTIIHGYHRDVPRSLSLEQLAKVAMIVNYYDCLESVEVYTGMWLEAFESELPAVYGRDCMLCLFTSWVFSRPTMFHSMTQLALRHSQRLIKVEDFPLPAEIMEEVDRARQSVLAEGFSAIYELLDRLQEEEECCFECSSMLLGVLTKELKRHGILYPRNAPPFNGFSVEGFKKMIRQLKQPYWRLYHKKFRHGCCIQDKLHMSMAKLESKLPVFNLQDFQTAKNHMRD